MKNLTILLAACITLLFTNCNKGGVSNSTVYTGIITFVGCTRVVIDIDGKQGTGKGIQWTDRDGNNLPNAISVSNYCYISGLKLQSGDKISFRESSSDITNTPPCLTVLCLMSGPDSDVNVYDVQKN